MQIIHSDSRFKTMRNYLGAFCKLTGFSASFHSAESHTQTEDFAMCRNAFCQLLQNYPGGKSLCQRAHDDAAERAHKACRAVKTKCPFGLSTFAVPVKSEEGAAATVLTGEVLLRPPSKSRLEKQLKRLFDQEAGYAADRSKLWNLFRRTRVVSRGEFQALGKTVQMTAESMGGADISSQSEEAIQTGAELEQTIAILQKDPFSEAYVRTRTARRILHENTAIKINRDIRHLRLKHLGGGKYAVTLSEPGGRNRTLLVR